MDEVRLRNGARVLIRPISPDDGARLESAFERLSPQARYQRFLAPKPRLTASDTRYLVEVDGCDHVALVATLAADPDWIIGVGRFVRSTEDLRAAELAIVVGDEFQAEGLGTELVHRLAEAARDRGIERLTATMLAHNVAARRLIGHISGRLSSRYLGPLHDVEVELAS